MTQRHDMIWVIISGLNSSVVAHTQTAGNLGVGYFGISPLMQPSLIKKRSVPTFVHLEKRSHFTILPLRL